MGYRGRTPVDSNIEYRSQFERDDAERKYHDNIEITTNFIKDCTPGFVIFFVFTVILYTLLAIFEWFANNMWLFGVLGAGIGIYSILIILKWKLQKERFLTEERERKELYEKYMSEAKDMYED